MGGTFPDVEITTIGPVFVPILLAAKNPHRRGRVIAPFLSLADQSLSVPIYVARFCHAISPSAWSIYRHHVGFFLSTKNRGPPMTWYQPPQPSQSDLRKVAAELRAKFSRPQPQAGQSPPASDRLAEISSLDPSEAAERQRKTPSQPNRTPVLRTKPSERFGPIEFPPSIQFGPLRDQTEPSMSLLLEIRQPSLIFFQPSADDTDEMANNC